jgi:polyphosphate glucokinase
MVSRVSKLAADWSYDAVSIGYPGAVLGGRQAAEAVNLGRGWIGFDFERAFGLPVKVMNDAAMQALGSYRGGKMLFLGLGTGLGSALIVEGVAKPMELGLRTALMRVMSAEPAWSVTVKGSGEVM